MSLSLLVGLKNNLLYTQHFYAETRLLYPEIEIVFVSYHSTDGTHEWLDSLQDAHVEYYYENEERTLSDTYNKCIELATSDYVLFAHNDMVLTPGFVEHLASLQSVHRVVFYTTVEPPIFADDERPGKIVRDFGVDIATFQRDALFQFSRQEQQKNIGENRNLADSNKISFFLCAARKVLLEIGGLDPVFNPMFCEDDDLILRLSLKGLEMVVSLNAICYHFVSKTSRFSDEYSRRTQQIEAQSNRNFIRKWGFRNNSSVKKTYDIGFVIRNGNVAILREIEPWCSTIYIDTDVETYQAEEQPRTSFDLSKKIKPLGEKKENGIIVSVDAKKIDAGKLAQIEYLHEAIHARIMKPRSFLSRLLAIAPPTFTWHGYRIRINDQTSYENQLISKF
ncbi:glycosyltransferase family 2 protein [Spirosoma jeollabukense]